LLRTIKQRLGRDDEQGFTLIELMVVVLIIAILLAIAIPTFLGARNSANARAAQSNLRNGLTAEQTYYTNNQAFGNTAGVSTIEPNLQWTDTGPVSASPAQVLVAIDTATPANGDWVILTAMGKDKNCWNIAQLNQKVGTAPAGTYYTKTALNGTGNCDSPGKANLPTAAPDATSTAAGGTAGVWYASF
jgi:type IV pilus assembly protein PilA